MNNTGTSKQNIIVSNPPYSEVRISARFGKSTMMNTLMERLPDVVKNDPNVVYLDPTI